MKIRLFSLYLLHILNDGFQSALLLLLPFISQNLGINIAQVGVLGTTLHLMGIIFAIPAGIVAAKYGGFRVATLSVLIYTLGFFGIVFSNSFALLLLAFVVAGIGFAPLPPVGLALLSRILDPDKRARGIGEYGAIGDMGRVAITATVSFLVALVGWQLTSSIYGAISLLAFVFLLWTFFWGNNKTQLKEEQPFEIRHLFRLLKNKLFVVSTTSAVIDTLASSQLFIFLPFLLINKNIDPILLGPFTAIYFFGNVAGKFIAGTIATKYGSAKVFMVSEVFMALMIVAIILSVHPTVILILSFILGFSTKWTSPTVQTMVIESAKEGESMEMYTSSYSFTRTIAKAGAPLLLGLIANSFGIVNAFYASAIIALIAIIPAFIFELSYRPAN